MSTIRFQIVAAIEAVLAAASAPVFPDYDSVEAGEDKGIIAGDWSDQYESNNLIDAHKLEFPLGFFARGASCDAVVDELQDEVIAALKSNAALKALIKRLKPGPVKGRRDGTGKVTAMLSQTVTIEFFTQAGSQTAPA
jgi:hypothetical protein